MTHLRAELLLGLIMAAVIATPAANSQTYYSTEAADSVGTMQGWYSTTTGLYTSTDGWWNSANSITTLSNYERVAGDNGYSSVFPNTYTNAQLSANGGHANFENMYYDDSGWWALAWIEAYDQTGNSSYLSMAETIFTYLTGGWTTTECGGGGMNWSTNTTYQNAIANEIFLDVAAKLYNRTGNSTYLNWANDEWNWFQASGMINSNNLINDGLNYSPTCGNNGATTWTYNQGVILGALVELAQANNDPALLTEAETIANAVLNPSNGLVNSNGILIENTGTGDNAQFKGVFARNLMALYQATNYSAYQSFIDTNANSIWANDQSTSGYDFGALWQGPYSSADPIAQSSASDALVAAEAVQGRYAAGPISTTGFGSIQMYTYDSSGNVWVIWQSRGNGGLIGPANWSSWTEMIMGSTHATGAPAVAMDVSLRQIVFIPTSSGVSYQSESNSGGSWGSWVAMGSSSSGLNNLVAINDEANGGLYVFGLNSSGTTYYASRANPYAAWSNFSSLGGTVLANYTVAENAQTGYLEVFGVGSNGAVYTDTQISLTTWSGWTAITGVIAQPYLSACQDSSGALHVFAIDTSGTAVWTNYQSSPGGSWQSSWQSLGNAATAIQPGFVCTANANGNLQFFGVGTDGHTYTKWNTGSWTSSWTSLAGVVNPYLVASSSADGRIVVFGISTGSPYNIYGTWESYPNMYSTWNSWSLWNGGGYKFYAGQP